MAITHQSELDRTLDINFASYVLHSGLAQLARIEGPVGRRIFVFDRPVDSQVLVAFHTSGAKRLLECHRSLKTAIHVM